MKILKLLGSILFVFITVIVVAGALVFYFASNRKTVDVTKGIAFKNKLSIPQLLEPKNENGKKIFELTLQSGKKELLPGKKADTWGINGDYLGPTLHMHTGDEVAVRVKNNLSETTTLHWHGMILPAAMDGGPHQAIKPGASWQPNWTVIQEAATLWYHPHVMEMTGEQVYKGLAGMIIVDDKNSESLALPKVYGVDDIPVIVQDRKFNTKGNLLYDHDHSRRITTGMLGNTILVNGTYAPYLDVPAKTIRLRLLNASNARRYNFGFADGHEFYQISTDGGFLEKPVKKDRLLLAPGERAEILVDLHDINETHTLVSFAVPPDENKIRGFMMSLLGGGTDEFQKFKILELRPKASGNAKASQDDHGHESESAIPQKLNSIRFFNASKATHRRTFKLNISDINGNKMDMDRIDQIVYKGSTEIWEIRNESPMYHPIHIHGVQFQVEGMDGWKDTVVVDPAKTVRLLVKFNDFSDPDIPYMYHCHILEHEDMGMMQQYVVVDKK